MENMVWIVAVAALGLSGILWMLRKAGTVSGRVDRQRALTFQVGAYRPMERLLAESDFEYLRAQPGFRPEIEKQLRAERRAIFRQYLRSLVEDFRALQFSVRELILSSPEDQSALIGELARQDLRFRMGLARVQVRLVLHAAHLGGAAVDIARLVEAAERMSSLMRALNQPVAATVQA